MSTNIIIGTPPCLTNIYPGDLNSGPHTYTASTLLIEQFPQPFSTLEEQILPGMAACACNPST